MTGEELAEIRARDAAAECHSPACHAASADRAALLAYVGVLQGHLGRALSLYLDCLMDMRLDDGERVLDLLLDVNPDLRDRLIEALKRT